MKKLLTLTVLLLLVSFTACDNNNDNDEIQVLTENNFADDDLLRANFNNNNLVKFLEHPGNQTTAKDTGDTGSDIIPVTYNEITENTFCWNDSDPDSEHTMTLFDSEGMEIFSLQANGNCITQIIEAGEYEVRLDHDGRIERTFPIFMINEEKGLVANNNQGNNSINSLYSVFNNIDLVKQAKAQTVQQNINTLLSTNECISCNLVGALLTGADLMLSDISGSELTGAILTSANLSDSTLIGVTMNNANLIQANLNGTTIIEGATFVGANLTGAALNDANLSQANFDSAMLTDTSLIAATLESTIFTDAIMIGANLLDTNLNDATLTGADLTGATFCNNCVCENASCDNCGSTSQCSIGDLGSTPELKKLTVEIDLIDIEMLQDEGLDLNIAIKVNDSFNVVWLSNKNYLESNEYEWEQDFEVFGTNMLETGSEVMADTNLLETAPGQTVKLNSLGVFEIEADPAPSDSINVINDFEPIYIGLTQKISLSSGIEESLTSFVTPDLNNMETEQLIPQNEVMLWFEENETGYILLEEPANNIKVDLSDMDDVKVNYSGGVWSIQDMQ